MEAERNVWEKHSKTISHPLVPKEPVAGLLLPEPGSVCTSGSDSKAEVRDKFSDKFYSVVMGKSHQFSRHRTTTC